MTVSRSWSPSAHFAGLFQLQRRRTRNPRKPQEMAKPLQRDRPSLPPSQQRSRIETRISHSFGRCSGCVPYFPIHVRESHPRYLPGLYPRTSVRWFETEGFQQSFTPIPFIGVSGKMSASTACFWTAYPQQIVATLTATVYQRLLRLVRRRHGYKYSQGCRETCFKAALYYTTTRDDWFLDRFLGIFKRRNRRAAHNLFTLVFSNLDENFRFVISQASKQASWLSFRCRAVVNPQYERRDKSGIKDTDSDFSLSFGEELEPDPVEIRVLWRKASQAWKTLHEHRHAATYSLSSDESSECDMFRSELSEDAIEKELRHWS